MSKQDFGSTRPSRDGHEFHETWVARLSLKLLWPDSNLAGIAVEGLSPDDKPKTSNTAEEIADATLYYGSHTNFAHCERATIVQIKYSITNKNKEFRASDAKKTIKKFAESFTSFKKEYGSKKISERLFLKIVTNRPIYQPLVEGIKAISENKPRTGEVKKQSDQFINATGLEGRSLIEFSSNITLESSSKSLSETNSLLNSAIISLSGTGDPIANQRIGKLKDLVRNKAGSAGGNDNLITQVDVLAALDLYGIDDLLPCETMPISIDHIIRREQLPYIIEQIKNIEKPLLIHAAGGVGKTVFMESIEQQLNKDNEVVFFDCFGGGSYRTIECARHQPKNGLLQIINTLAFRSSLCDPLLPGNSDPTRLMRIFRQRLQQCIKTLHSKNPKRNLVILIDAVDNAEIIASNSGEKSFPYVLLQSFNREPIDGVKIIVSCRSERKDLFCSNYEEFELLPFSKREIKSYLCRRLGKVSDIKVGVIQARTGGIPRIIDMLLSSHSEMFNFSDIEKPPIELDSLIHQQIESAIETMHIRGEEKNMIDLFLAGLARLPLPIPIDEYSSALGLESNAIESFASDMAPLVEYTNNGLIVRDEPTETFIRKKYASSKALKDIAHNLHSQQEKSVYAAKALPMLLYALNDGMGLFNLAFDERIPDEVTSTVGKRNIRYQRLKAATLHAVKKKDFNQLVHLLVELSTIALIDQKGVDYLLNNPDLVAIIGDPEAMRRLFEVRSGWQGTRHTRLVVANTLAGNLDEASFHLLEANKWIVRHLHREHGDQDPEAEGPKSYDFAAMPFCLIVRDEIQSALSYINDWHNLSDWYVFEIFEHLFGYLRLAISRRTLSINKFNLFIRGLTKPSHIVAALTFCNFNKSLTTTLIERLRRQRRMRLNYLDHYQYSEYRSQDLADGFIYSSAQALKFGLTAEATAIASYIHYDYPRLWLFHQGVDIDKVFKFIAQVALLAAAKGKDIHEKDILPLELKNYLRHISKKLTSKVFVEKAREKISAISNENRENSTNELPTSLNYKNKREAGIFITYKLEPLLNFTRALSSTLAASPRKINRIFQSFIDIWEHAIESNDPYGRDSQKKFFQFLGLKAIELILSTRTELNVKSMERFINTGLVHNYVGPFYPIRLLTIMATRPSLQELTLTKSIQIRESIRSINDVTERSKLYASLAHAVLPASYDDADLYFREGMNQLDAIGSESVDFTSDLLHFSSYIKGNELKEPDFHTFSNIIEHNLNCIDVDKFSWPTYGIGMANIAGLRGLAKLTRWEDRNLIPLADTLLPYLIGLLKCDKISPRNAISLNHLAMPVKCYYASTKEFADEIHKKIGYDSKIITALIEQYLKNVSVMRPTDTMNRLSYFADEALNTQSYLSKYIKSVLSALLLNADKKYEYETHISPQNTNYQKNLKNRKLHIQRKAVRIIEGANPNNKTSLIDAVSEFRSLEYNYEFLENFLQDLRNKVKPRNRGQYLRLIADLDNFSFSMKIDEFSHAKNAWAKSSASLNSIFHEIAIPLIQQHHNELLDGLAYHWRYVRELSNIANIPEPDLAVELINIFARPDSNIQANEWLTLASYICSEADADKGQTALSRILSNNETTTLADRASDGPWAAGIYPTNNFTEVAVGLIWRTLGSPETECRWQAAHCLRDFAKSNQWHIVDELVKNINSTDAGPFHSPEFKFYYMHAKLWLLIALARLALDYPKDIAKYSDILLDIINDEQPHVLMRSFAANSIMACIKANALNLSPKLLESVKNVNKSQRPRVKRQNKYGCNFEQHRPENFPKPAFDVFLDSDFEKIEVYSLGRIFDIETWKINDMISEFVHTIDPCVSSIYYSDNREPLHGHKQSLLSDRFHNYGHYLVWHGLFVTAGKLLNSYSILDSDCGDDPWTEWLNNYLLSRDDGFWLADGKDNIPVDTLKPLLEPKGDELAITGDKSKILSLVGIFGDRLGKKMVIDGLWFSSDHISVNVSSAMVSSKKAKELARKLIREESLYSWLPTYDDYGSGEYTHYDEEDFIPWVVSPRGETFLDKYDPYAVSTVHQRSRLAFDYEKLAKLKKDDPFGRIWKNHNGTVYIESQAWGSEETDSEDGPHPCRRLLCRSSLIKKILTECEKDLIVLVNLKRWKNTLRGTGYYTNSVGVVHVTRNLDVSYFKGAVNKPHR